MRLYEVKRTKASLDMGFFINEPTEFSLYGITTTNAYVTIRGKYKHDRIIESVNNVLVTKYSVSVDYIVLTGNNYDLQPIQTGSISVLEDVPVVDAITKLYAAIKVQDFPGKTFTDDI